MIIGIPACTRDINGHEQHATPSRYGEAVIGAVGGIPVLIPPVGPAAIAILDRIDGLLLSGSPSNIEPARFGASADLTPELHDPTRDSTTLPLILAALDRGVPIMAICRGIQELNVALGGTLHQKVHEVPGRFDHRGGPGTREDQYRPKHDIALSGSLAHILGRAAIQVNSVHQQAIDRLAAGLVVEATAPDGTIEAVRVIAASFAIGVQWHPEWRFAEDVASMRMFTAFGDACRVFAATRREAA